MAEEKKTVTIQHIFMIEHDGPSYSDFNFSLRLMGETPGGKRLNVVAKFPAWGVEYIAEKLHAILKKQEALLQTSRSTLERGVR